MTVKAQVPRLETELWTNRQRQMHSLHYVFSYRASFKPELPDYFIRLLSRPGDVVGDPFCGRGTTILQANLLGRRAFACDISPLAIAVTTAKTRPAAVWEVRQLLQGLDWQDSTAPDDGAAADLLVFYHPRTLTELCILKKNLVGREDRVAGFVRLLALSRLHGHSTGFFSTYSLPQLSVTPQAQKRINEKKGFFPEYRPVVPRIINKAQAALRDNMLTEILRAGRANRYFTGDARELVSWPSHSVDLIVTSPPFLSTVDYLAANWLEYWFLEYDVGELRQKFVQTSSITIWRDFMTEVFYELGRVLKPGAYCVIEAGDVSCRGSKINLDEVLLELVMSGGPQKLFRPKLVLVHRQRFSKISHCFQVTNNQKGTNTQRLLVLEKK